MVDNTGVIIAAYEYDPFVSRVQEESASDPNPYRYCGEYDDVESGLTYLRARYYDAAAGRFISEDPVRDGMNWYVYCGGNPIQFVTLPGMWL